MALNTVQLQPRHMLNLSLLVGCTLSIIVGILFFLTACIFPDDISCAVPDFAFVLLLSIIWVGIPSAVATWTVSAVASTTLSVPIVPKLLLATLMSSFVGIIIVLALRHALTSPQTLLVSALTGGAVAGTIQGLFLHRTTLSIPVWIIFSGALWVIGVSAVNATTSTYGFTVSLALFWFSGIGVLILISLVVQLEQAHSLRHRAWSTVWLAVSSLAWILTTGVFTDIK